MTWILFLNPDHEYLKKENNSEWGGDAAWEALSFSLGSMSWLVEQLPGLEASSLKLIIFSQNENETLHVMSHGRSM